MNSNLYNLIKHITVSADLLFLILMVFSFMNYLPDSWNLKYAFFFVLIINTLFFLFKLKKMPEIERDKSSIVYVSKYFFILSLIVLAVNQFIKNPFLTSINPYLIGISIALGFLTFYSNKEKVESDLEFEKYNEEQSEKQRKEDFQRKFPLINKIPILRGLVRWMYKEGWIYSIGLIIIVIWGFILRIWNLGKQSLWIDEITSMTAVKSIVNTGLPKLPSGILYSRDLFVNYLFALAELVFGANFSLLRIIPIMFGLGSIVLVYLLAKKIFNKKIALLSAGILSLLTFEIAWSRQLRFYIFLQFFLLLSTLLYIKLKENQSKKYFIIFLGSLILLLFTGFPGIMIFITFAADIIFDRTTLFNITKLLKKNKFIFIIFAILFVIFLYTGTFLKALEIFFGALASPNFSLNDYYNISIKFFPYITYLFIISIFCLIIKNKVVKSINLYLILTILLISIIFPGGWARYLLIIIPFAIIYISFCIIKIISIKNKFVLLILLIIILSPLLISDVSIIPKNQYSIQEPQTNFDLAYNYVYNNIKPNQAVISISTGNIPASFYLEDKFILSKNYVFTLLSEKYSEDYRLYYENGVSKEGYTNSVVITTNEELKDVLKNNDGYLVFDQQKVYHIDGETKKVLDKMTLISDYSDNTIKLYKWNKSYFQS